MRQEKQDPIAQAMQLLQFITQRRGQQADQNLGQQRLDLMSQQLGLERSGQEAQLGLQRERMGQEQQFNQQQFEAQQQARQATEQRAMLEAALAATQNERDFGFKESQARLAAIHQQKMLEEAQRGNKLQEQKLFLKAAPIYTQGLDFAEPGTPQANYRDALLEAVKRFVAQQQGFQLPSMPQPDATTQQIGY